MPMTPIVIRRWQMILVLVAVTGAFVFGLIAVTDNFSGFRAQVKRDAAQNLDFRKLRDEQIKALHKVDVRACLGTHKIVVAVVKQLNTQIRTGPINIPDLTPGQLAQLMENRKKRNAGLRDSIRSVNKADCTTTPAPPKAPS